MNTKNLLKQYDKNISAMWDELSDRATSKERYHYSKIKNIKLRLFEPRNTWRLDFLENGAPVYEQGGVFDQGYGNSYEVNYIADQIQTDFLLNNDSKRIVKNCCREGVQLSLLWQVIWIVETKVDYYDNLLKYPIDCILIYDNQRVYTTKHRKGKGYRDFIADKDYSIEEFLNG
jgi:hypothetical protein